MPTDEHASYMFPGAAEFDGPATHFSVPMSTTLDPWTAMGGQPLSTAPMPMAPIVPPAPDYFAPTIVAPGLPPVPVTSAGMPEPPSEPPQLPCGVLGAPLDSQLLDTTPMVMPPCWPKTPPPTSPPSLSMPSGAAPWTTVAPPCAPPGVTLSSVSPPPGLEDFALAASLPPTPTPCAPICSLVLPATCLAQVAPVNGLGLANDEEKIATIKMFVEIVSPKTPLPPLPPLACYGLMNVPACTHQEARGVCVPDELCQKPVKVALPTDALHTSFDAFDNFSPVKVQMRAY